MQAKKQELKECLLADIQDKQRNADADRNGLDLAVGEVFGGSDHQNT